MRGLSDEQFLKEQLYRVTNLSHTLLTQTDVFHDYTMRLLRDIDNGEDASRSIEYVRNVVIEAMREVVNEETLKKAEDNVRK